MANALGLIRDSRKIVIKGIEAEDMKLEGYKTYTVSPFETASGSVAIVTTSNSQIDLPL
jgi:hypothetical protein